jgi:hypothetical protein
MSLTQSAAADGQSATWSLNGSPVISTGAGGLQFQKNKLINGEVTRINQRTFNGTWSGKSVWETQPATIAGKEVAYGYDMWFRSNAARSDGTGASENMAQWIEAGNYRPSTVHTLSGTGVTTTQITSPASGDWKIVVAQGATNVQVEEGKVATPFEIRSTRYELAECQRYYELGNWVRAAPYVRPTGVATSDANCFASVQFKATKRTTPSMAGAGAYASLNSWSDIGVASASAYLTANNGSGEAAVGSWSASAVI